MSWTSLSAFLAMGGYADFVWGSYAVTAACVALELAVLVTRHRRLRRELASRGRGA
jgi:heme exporter protein D